MEEIWKDIKGYEGLYKISNFGRVWSLYKNRFKKVVKFPNGYYYVALNKNGKSSSIKISVLVAKHFLSNPSNLPEVNHIDEDKSNNNVDNLEWCDRKYNCNHGTRNQRISEKKINGKKSKKVFQYDLDGNFIKEWPSTREIQRQTGFKQSNVSACCRNVIKQSYGFIWKFKEPQAS